MRDINRIEPFLKDLSEYWKKVPDWRFGQLLINVLGTSKIDPFFLEEKEFLKLFEDFFESHGYGKNKETTIE